MDVFAQLDRARALGVRAAMWSTREGVGLVRTVFGESDDAPEVENAPAGVDQLQFALLTAFLAGMQELLGDFDAVLRTLHPATLLQLTDGLHSHLQRRGKRSPEAAEALANMTFNMDVITLAAAKRMADLDVDTAPLEADDYAGYLSKGTREARRKEERKHLRELKARAVALLAK
jgi:hypothetical protein